MNDSSDIAALREWAGAHHVPPAALDRWLGLGESGAFALWETARNLRMRTGQLLSALEMVSEIALREGESAESVLKRQELRAILRSGGSRPERASAFVEKLRELRYPRLARTHARLQTAVAALKLPPGIALVLPKDLSSDELTIRIKVRTPAELENLLDALQSRVAGLVGILEALGGADEI